MRRFHLCVWYFGWRDGTCIPTLYLVGRMKMKRIHHCLLSIKHPILFFHSHPTAAASNTAVTSYPTPRPLPCSHRGRCWPRAPRSPTLFHATISSRTRASVATARGPAGMANRRWKQKQHLAKWLIFYDRWVLKVCSKNRFWPHVKYICVAVKDKHMATK